MSSDLALELIRGDNQRELKWWGKQITSYFGNYVIISHLMQDLLALRIYQSHDIHLLSIMSRMCISGVFVYMSLKACLPLQAGGWGSLEPPYVSSLKSSKGALGCMPVQARVRPGPCCKLLWSPCMYRVAGTTLQARGWEDDMCHVVFRWLIFKCFFIDFVCWVVEKSG
jgi:hypothetical protein